MCCSSPLLIGKESGGLGWCRWARFGPPNNLPIQPKEGVFSMLLTLSPCQPSSGKTHASLKGSPIFNISASFLSMCIFTSFKCSLHSTSRIQWYLTSMIRHENSNSCSNELHSDFHKREHNISYAYPIFWWIASSKAFPFKLLYQQYILLLCNTNLQFRLLRNSSLWKSDQVTWSRLSRVNITCHIRISVSN